MVQRQGRRVLNPKARVQLSVAERARTCTHASARTHACMHMCVARRGCMPGIPQRLGGHVQGVLRLSQAVFDSPSWYGRGCMHEWTGARACVCV